MKERTRKYIKGPRGKYLDLVNSYQDGSEGGTVRDVEIRALSAQFRSFWLFYGLVTLGIVVMAFGFVRTGFGMIVLGILEQPLASFIIDRKYSRYRERAISVLREDPVANDLVKEYSREHHPEDRNSV